MASSDSSAIKIPGYKLLKRLGASSLGVVARAKDEKTGKSVAVKIFRSKAMPREANFFTRFTDVMNRVKNLEHPNIAQVVETGHSGSIYYLVTEYLKGTSLDKLIEQKRVFSEEETIKTMNQIAKALEALRKAELTHGDLKPSNVMVCQDDAVKLLDSCVARSLRGQFGSPEDSGVRGQSGPNWGPDMNSLGVMAFMMLSAQVPKPPEGTPLRDYMLERVGELKSTTPPTSDYLCNIIRRLMARKPGEGFKTPNDLIIELVSASIFRRQSVPTSRTTKEKQIESDLESRKTNLEKAQEISEKKATKSKSGKKKRRRVIILEDDEDEEELIAQIEAGKISEEELDTRTLRAVRQAQGVEIETDQEEEEEEEEEEEQEEQEEVEESEPAPEQEPEPAAETDEPELSDVPSSSDLATLKDISEAIGKTEPSVPTQASFFFWQERNRGVFFVLKEGDEISLGRDSSKSDILVMDGKVSRKHCTISMHDGKIILKDMGSANGTYVNKKQVKERLLGPTDRVRIGLTTIYQDLDPSTAPTPQELAVRAKRKDVDEKTKVDMPAAPAPVASEDSDEQPGKSP